MLDWQTQREPSSSIGWARLRTKSYWYFVTRWRSVLDDFAYASAAVIFLLMSTVVHEFIQDGLNVSLADRLHMGVSILGRAIVGLPAVAFLIVALRVAPSRGLYRWIFMIAAVSLIMVWGNRVAVLLFHQDPGFDHISQSVVSMCLVGIGCFLRNTMRHVEGDLHRTRFESGALDAEFKSAQLELLRAQIEPHFLFNTLATVRTLAQQDLRMGADMIDNVLRYFMAALPKLRQSESSLAEEMDLIDAYLRIQQVRIGSRLSYQLSIPEILLAAKVPSVMLLTLVENAIKHGISPSATGGVVHVSATRDESSLMLRVVDSGQGMQTQLGHGTGLANIRARLELLYHDRAALSLTSAAPRGVVATLQIPLEAAV
jgi:two-component sensor histidine kinase